MPGIGDALTRRIGPLPGWAWAGLVAVGAWYFLLRGRAGAPSTQNAAAAGSQLSSGYGLGYAQGLQAAGPGPAPPPASPAARRGTITGNPAGVFVGPATSSGTIGLLQQGTKVTVTGPPVQGETWGGVSYWYPVDQGGRPGYVAGALIDLDQQGVGGPRSIGSRSAYLMHHAHPLIGAPVRYQYHVRAVGGAPNHAREVHRVAEQAGVHPARLMALNPTYTGYIRVA